jgi:hypothetical protein
LTLWGGNPVTPREFLEAVVRPNVDEFHIHFADLRHAHNAVSAIDALAAHLYIWATVNAASAVASVKTDSLYRATLSARSPDFALLRDIAKAQKHVHLTMHNPQVTRADQIVSRTIRYGEGLYGAGRYGGGQQVVVDITPGNFVYLETTIDKALEFIEAEMAALNCR